MRIMTYFQGTELHQNPYLDRRHGLDREQFKPVLDEFYRLHGWDERGWPTAQRLRELDVENVYGEMVDGAARAAAGADRLDVEPTRVGGDRDDRS